MSEHNGEWCADPRGLSSYRRTVTRVTPVPAGIADTLLTGRQYRPATEGKQMKLFTDTTGTQNLTKIIVVALALAFLATVLS